MAEPRREVMRPLFIEFGGKIMYSMVHRMKKGIKFDFAVEACFVDNFAFFEWI